MVAKCANPECNRQFRQLNKGKLFLLPPSQDPAILMWKVGKLTDYCYWLCPKCSQTYTIGRQGSELIVSRREQSKAPNVIKHPKAA
jgi:hypothetical protein